MGIKTFSDKLKKIIDKDGSFVTDTIDMEELKQSASEQGFDDAIFVAGEDHNEVFLLCVQKITL